MKRAPPKKCPTTTSTLHALNAGSYGRFAGVCACFIILNIAEIVHYQRLVSIGLHNNYLDRFDLSLILRNNR